MLVIREGQRVFRGNLDSKASGIGTLCCVSRVLTGTTRARDGSPLPGGVDLPRRGCVRREPSRGSSIERLLGFLSIAGLVPGRYRVRSHGAGGFSKAPVPTSGGRRRSPSRCRPSRRGRGRHWTRFRDCRVIGSAVFASRTQDRLVLDVFGLGTLPGRGSPNAFDSLHREVWSTQRQQRCSTEVSGTGRKASGLVRFRPNPGSKLLGPLRRTRTPTVGQGTNVRD